MFSTVKRGKQRKKPSDDQDEHCFSELFILLPDASFLLVVLCHIFIFSLLLLCLFTHTDTGSIRCAPCALMQREITHRNHDFIYRGLAIHKEHVFYIQLTAWMMNVKSLRLHVKSLKAGMDLKG